MANYTTDANCMGAFLMEDATTETDASSNGNNLTVSTGDTIEQTAEHKFGTYARVFTASDGDYLYHADGLSTDISGANQPLSIVAYVNRQVDTGSLEGIVTKYTTLTSNKQYRLGLDGADAPIFTASDNGSDYYYAYGATTIAASSGWRHLAGVYNDTDLRVYVDGSLDSNGANNPLAYTAGLYNGTEPFYIGMYNGSPQRLFSGYIDDVGIFNRELTSVEISDIATNGLVGSAATSTGEVLPASATTSAIGAWADVDWVRTAAILSQGDATAAAACISDAAFDISVQSYLLKASNFGISIPAGYSVAGVICRLEAWATLSCCIDHLKLLDTSRVETGDNEAASVATTIIISATTQTLSFGGSANNWGCSLSETWVENANFGVAIGARALANNADLFVDYVTLEVCYVAPPAAATPLSLKYFFVEC